MITTDYLYNLIIDGIKLPTTRENDPSIINASALYNSCPRAFLLSLKNGVLMHSTKKPFDSELVTYKIGLKIESIIKEALSNYLEEVDTFAIPVGKDFTLIGHPDIIIKYNDDKYIIEVKSIDKDAYDKLSFQPLYRHEFQLKVYLYLAKKYKYPIKYGFLLYVAKGHRQPPIKIYQVKLTRNDIKMLDRFLSNLVTKDMTQSCSSKYHAKTIKCPVLEICFGENDEFKK